jgi:cytochrome c553
MKRSIAIGIVTATGIGLAFLVGGLAAQPSSKVAWTPEQVRFVRQGNPEYGKAIAEACDNCHTANPENAETPYPYLPGQLDTYLFRQMRDYRDASRLNDLMAGILADATDQGMADVAAWYSRQPLILPAAAAEDFAFAKAMASKGDVQRNIPPCAVCHGADGLGQVIDVPRLGGQKADYLEQTLSAYKFGQRRNDVYGRMRDIAKKLKDDEIRELARYFAALRP